MYQVEMYLFVKKNALITNVFLFIVSNRNKNQRIGQWSLDMTHAIWNIAAKQVYKIDKILNLRQPRRRHNIKYH